MSEQPSVQALLNTEQAPPSSEAEFLHEHPLELQNSLEQADSMALPDMFTSKMVSERFTSLENNNFEATNQLLQDDGDHIEGSTLTQPPPPLPSPRSPTATKHEHERVSAAPTTPKYGITTTQVEGATQEARRAEVDAEAAARREHDVAAAFAALPQAKPRWTNNYFKILLVGDDGLGKTTFVRNLFAAFASDVDFPVADASADSNAAAIFRRHPERLCTELVLQDEKDMVWWHYQVQDTPGYGDFDGPEDAEAQRTAVLSHVRECSRMYLRHEIDTNRRCPMQGVPDSRIDVCLYFISPHRLRRADKVFMRDLAQAGIPTIPIIAKADTLTPEELKQYRGEVRDALEQSGWMPWHFSREALEEAGAHGGLPFCVISAATLDRSVGRFWPVRRYPWGRCEALSTAHSDLPVLRKLLLETAYWELKGTTEARYLKFRKTERASEANPVPRPLRPLLRLAVGAALTGAAVVLAVNTWPLMRDRVVRREVVRRVKDKVTDKVGAVVDTAVGAVQEAQGKAEDAAQSIKRGAGSAVAVGRQKASAAASKLELPEVRKLREEAEAAAAASRAKPWWQFWGRGG